MKVLELAGPSGTGKSTLAASLVARGFQPAAPVTFEGARNGIRAEPSVAAFVDLLDRVFATARAPVDTRRSFACRTLWRLILARRSGRPTVLDGGLLRRAHAIDDLKSDVSIEDYYRRMPMADLTVFLEADEETIIARNIQRETPERAGTIKRALELDAIARGILADRGAYVVTVDAGMSADEVAKTFGRIL